MDLVLNLLDKGTLGDQSKNDRFLFYTFLTNGEYKSSLLQVLENKTLKWKLSALISRSELPTGTTAGISTMSSVNAIKKAITFRLT